MSAHPFPATDSVPGEPVIARRRSWARPGLAVLAGALALSLAACGGGTTANTPAAAAPTSGAARGGGQGGAPGVFGIAAAVTATNVEVQSQQSGQTTVNFSSTTTFTNDVTVALADVTVGSCVSVIGSSGGGGQPVAARTVTISSPGANGCVRPALGRAGGSGASRRPNPSRQPRPSGANGAGRGNFGGAFGAVSAVSATGFTVHGTNPGTNAATDANVTVSSSTTYVKTESATSSALAVGVCVAAIGVADDTGAVAAKTITISKATNGACTNGFGGGRRGGFGGGGASGSGGGNG